MHRKRFAVFMVVVASLFTLATSACTAPASSPAAAPSTHGGKVKVVQLKPYFTATGGGCHSKMDTFMLHESVTVQGCISGSGGLTGWTIYPDGYVDYATDTSSWTACSVALKATDETNHIVRESGSQTCLSDANAGGQYHYTLAPFGNVGICPLLFETTITLTATWNGTTPVNVTVNSPIESINC